MFYQLTICNPSDFCAYYISLRHFIFAGVFRSKIKIEGPRRPGEVFENKNLSLRRRWWRMMRNMLHSLLSSSFAAAAAAACVSCGSGPIRIFEIKKIP